MSSSAEAASNCPSTGALACYYNGTSYSGARGAVLDSLDFTGTCYFNQLDFTTASSLYNNSVNTHTWYSNANYSGSTVSVGAQSGRTSLSSALNNNVKRPRFFAALIRVAALG